MTDDLPTRAEERAFLQHRNKMTAYTAIRPTLRGCALLAIAHGVDQAEFLDVASQAFGEVWREVPLPKAPRARRSRRKVRAPRGKQSKYGPRAGRNK
jgi:hypothetical protein